MKKKLSSQTINEKRTELFPGLLFFFLSILILWQMLLPGYVLTLDMVFGPHTDLITHPDGFWNFLPVNFFIFSLSFILPAWIIQKIILLALFFCMGFLTYKYIPFIEDKNTRLFCGVLSMITPFVYGRFLAGQWTLLFAYSFLPLFFHFLFCIFHDLSLKNVLKFFGILFLISIFSIHIFTMTAIITIVALGIILFRTKQKKIFYKHIGIGVMLFLIVTSYWTVPAVFRSSPLEQRFTATHFTEFAASGHNDIPVLANLITLNGFWGEGVRWKNYFAWPQDISLFWIGFLGIGFLIALGMYVSWKNKQRRKTILALLFVGIISFIFATGASDTIFRGINIWCFSNIPFWKGFRDSQKFIAIVSFVYVLMAGLGFEKLRHFEAKRKKNMVNILSIACSIVLILYGYLFIGGFQKQLMPVFYPDSWQTVKESIEQDKDNANVLVLPWHGYMSFPFNNNLLIANPAKKYFGNTIIAGKSVELGELYDQETDPVYSQADNLINNQSSMTPKQIASTLQSLKIKYILFFNNLSMSDTNDYSQVISLTKRIIDTPEIQLYSLSTGNK